MSLVGTRPPTVDEWEKYELHHRSRIHYVAFDQKYRQWISANFKKAFGEELIPFTQNGNNIPYDTVVPLINMNYDGLKTAIIEMLSGSEVKVNTATFKNDTINIKSS